MRFGRPDKPRHHGVRDGGEWEYPSMLRWNRSNSILGQLELPDLEPPDVALWTVVLLAMILDIGLTIFGLEQGLIEQNPIAVAGMDMFGYAVLAFLKVPALLIGLIGWSFLSPTMRRLNLVGLALPWVFAVVTNLWLIIS